jgi:hypothetical protein
MNTIHLHIALPFFLSLSKIQQDDYGSGASSTKEKKKGEMG